MLRAERGLTLRQVADLTGVAKETLSDIERGKRHPHDVTLSKLAAGYGIAFEELLDLKEEEKDQEDAALASAGKAEAPLAKSEARESPSEAQRSLSYVNAWATFVDELSGDIEEWKYEQTGGALDPADLPEDEFLPFIFSAMPFVQTYQRVHQVVYADEVGLLPLLQEEVRLRGRMDKEVERFERAFRRLSRTMQGMLTERVAQRVNQLAQAEERKVPENVVSLFGEVSGEARGVA
jgi:transcriptional regulator with XRE-family HTH domain